MFHIPRVWHSLPVAPLEVICGWADDFGNDEGSFTRGRELMHVVGLLDAPGDKIANIEGRLLNVVIMISSKLLVMTSLSHDGSKPLLFKAVQVNTTCLLGFSFLVELDVWSSKGDVGR
jgi:hypothetical protein